jgi:hypothetical protein
VKRAHASCPAAVQKEAADALAALADLRAQVADLEEQVMEATAQLKRETEAKVNTEDALSRVNEALEASMSACEELRRQLEDQGLELDERSVQVRPRPACALRHYTRRVRCGTLAAGCCRAARATTCAGDNAARGEGGDACGQCAQPGARDTQRGARVAGHKVRSMASPHAAGKWRPQGYRRRRLSAVFSFSRCAACRAEELRQSQLLSLSTSVASTGAGGADGAHPLQAELAQREHVIDVLRTEVQAGSVRLGEAVAAAASRERELTRDLDDARAGLRAAEIERDDMHVQALDALKEVERLNEDCVALQARPFRSVVFGVSVSTRAAWRWSRALPRPR